MVTPAGSLLGPNRLAFPVGVAPSERGKFLARFVAQELKAGKVAVLTSDKASNARAIVDAFREEFGKVKGAVAELVAHSDADWADVAKRTTAETPDAILVVAAPEAVFRARDELKRAGIGEKTPLLFGGEADGTTVFVDDADRSRGIFTVGAWAAEDESTRAVEFRKRYQDKFGRLPSAAAALSYEAAHLLITAAGRAKSVQAKPLRDELARPGEAWEVLTGELRFAPADQTARRPVFVSQIADGQSKMVKRYEPDPEK
jgi:branched-chain amino acid transport system substrate-binding protein